MTYKVSSDLYIMDYGSISLSVLGGYLLFLMFIFICSHVPAHRVIVKWQSFLGFNFSFPDVLFIWQGLPRATVPCNHSFSVPTLTFYSIAYPFSSSVVSFC